MFKKNTTQAIQPLGALEDVGKETEYLISENGKIYWKKG